MPIPARFKTTRPTRELLKRMCVLCDEIERAVNADEDPAPLLEKWHVHANQTYVPSDFTTYYGSKDQETFVREALYPRPSFVNDLQYDEARAVLEAITTVDLKEAEITYYLDWLEAQFPNSNMSDLIYWPDEWFEDASLFRDANGAFKPEVELSVDQMLGYAMKRSARILPGAPADVELPYKMPVKPSFIFGGPEEKV